MSGFSLHIKCGGGRQARSGEVEAARGSSPPARGPTAAPETRALAVLSASLLAVPSAWPGPQKERGVSSGRKGSALREKGGKPGRGGSCCGEVRPWPGRELSALARAAGPHCLPRAPPAAPSRRTRPPGEDPAGRTGPSPPPGASGPAPRRGRPASSARGWRVRLWPPRPPREAPRGLQHWPRGRGQKLCAHETSQPDSRTPHISLLSFSRKPGTLFFLKSLILPFILVGTAYIRGTGRKRG